MASFEYDGRQITCLTSRTMQLGDLAFIKEHWGIGGMRELEAGQQEYDPDAWRAVLVASVRRVMPEVSPVDSLVDLVVLEPLVDALNAETKAVVDAAGGDRPTKARTRARSGSRG